MSVYVFVHVYMCFCVYVCLDVRVCLCTRVCLHMCVCTCMCLFITEKMLQHTPDTYATTLLKTVSYTVIF